MIGYIPYKTGCFLYPKDIRERKECTSTTALLAYLICVQRRNGLLLFPWACPGRVCNWYALKTPSSALIKFSNILEIHTVPICIRKQIARVQALEDPHILRSNYHNTSTEYRSSLTPICSNSNCPFWCGWVYLHRMNRTLDSNTRKMSFPSLPILSRFWQLEASMNFRSLFLENCVHLFSFFESRIIHSSGSAS